MKLKKCNAWDVILTFSDGTSILYLDSKEPENYREIWKLINKEFRRREKTQKPNRFLLKTARGGELAIDLREIEKSKTTQRKKGAIKCR